MNGPGESVEDLERILCADGRCIGTINEKGVCNICGRKSSARGRVQEETPIVVGSDSGVEYKPSVESKPLIVIIVDVIIVIVYIVGFILAIGCAVGLLFLLIKLIKFLWYL